MNYFWDLNGGNNKGSSRYCKHFESVGNQEEMQFVCEWNDINDKHKPKGRTERKLGNQFLVWNGTFRRQMEDLPAKTRCRYLL